MRVVRYFSFVDLCGFTRFGDAHGDEAAVAVLTGFRSAVRGVASDHGVRVAKWLGDGAMFVSTEGQALVSTVLELAPRLDGEPGVLPLRAGLAGGPVILFEGDDYIGGPVNLASRLCDVAQPYEALVAANLASLLDGTHGLPGRHQVPGFAQPVDVVALGLQDASDEELVT
ncbi:MAG: adenylate/guanylate cyclase domain-containing protein [Acidimicrobiia bacterium]